MLTNTAKRRSDTNNNKIIESEASLVDVDVDSKNNKFKISASFRDFKKGYQEIVKTSDPEALSSFFKNNR